MAVDLLVQDGLREERLVDLVVAHAAVADHVDDAVLPVLQRRGSDTHEAMAEFFSSDEAKHSPHVHTYSYFSRFRQGTHHTESEKVHASVEQANRHNLRGVSPSPISSEAVRRMVATTETTRETMSRKRLVTFNPKTKQTKQQSIKNEGE